MKHGAKHESPTTAIESNLSFNFGLVNAYKGPGVGGERTVEMCVALRGRSSSNGFREPIHLHGILLTPKPLSRVGERGADWRACVRLRPGRRSVTIICNPR